MTTAAAIAAELQSIAEVLEHHHFNHFPGRLRAVASAVAGLDWTGRVLGWSRAFGQHVAATPGVPHRDVAALRVRLLHEELDETMDAVVSGDLPALADGLGDLIFVCLGTAAAYGIDMRGVFDAVCAANDAKGGGGRREDGKVMKSDSWVPPDVAGILARQAPLFAAGEAADLCPQCHKRPVSTSLGLCSWCDQSQGEVHTR